MKLPFSLKVRKIEFTARCTNPAVLYRFSNRTVRGALGNVLMWLGMDYYEGNRRRENDLYQRLYHKVFKCEEAGRFKPHRGGSQPNPYVIECDSFSEKAFRPGDTLRFSITLFGDFACDHARAFVTAAKLMLCGDFGGNIDCFALDTALEQSNHRFYYRETRYCDTPDAWEWTSTAAQSASTRRNHRQNKSDTTATVFVKRQIGMRLLIILMYSTLLNVRSNM